MSAVGTAALLQQLGQQLGQQTGPKPTKKAKEAGVSTCKLCNGEYTDGSGSGSGTRYNWGYCNEMKMESTEMHRGDVESS
jgi:hypothetical protein